MEFYKLILFDISNSLPPSPNKKYLSLILFRDEFDP